MIEKNTQNIIQKRKRALKLVRALRRLIPHAECVLHYKNPWELLVAVELSAQCTDTMVNKVTEKLFKKYKTLDDYIKASANWRTVREFERDIYSTGFYRNKARNILAAAKLVKGKYNGKIPKTMEEILTLPGVARKTANVVLGNAYGVVDGIAVDTHVMRLSKRFGLTEEKTPEKIERDLMKILPKKEWFDFTYRIIEYGRNYCTAKKCPIDHPLRQFDVWQ